MTAQPTQYLSLSPEDREKVARFVVSVVQHWGSPETIITRKPHKPIPVDAAVREQQISEIKRLLTAWAFTPKDFFLTQAPPPAWIWQNETARIRWERRERRRRQIAQLMARCGLTAHDLVSKVSELPSDTGAVGRGKASAPIGEPLMDMSKYAGGSFLRVADLKESGPIKVKIAAVEPGNFDKPDVTFDSGDVLSLNATNCAVLCRAYGSESADWLGKQVELSVGTFDYNGKPTEGIKVKPISPPLENKKPVTPKKKKKDGSDLEGPPPF